MRNNYSIGALSRLSGVNVETIRYYERVDLLPAPARGPNGYRHYDDAAVQRLAFVRRGRELGFTLTEIRGLLDLVEHPDRSCRGADELVLGHLVAIEAKIRDLERMREALKELANCPNETAESCRLIQTLGSPHGS
jgi:DNA-binding transcriptional MerR regulator